MTRKKKGEEPTPFGVSEAVRQRSIDIGDQVYVGIVLRTVIDQVAEAGVSLMRLNQPVSGREWFRRGELRLAEAGPGTPSCRTCRFWKWDGGRTSGLCRRNAPTAAFIPVANEAMEDPVERFAPAWPATDSTDWCGDHEQP